MYATLTPELFMDQQQLEILLGNRMYDFVSDDGRYYKGGFFQVPLSYRHTEIEDQIDQLRRNTHINFTLGTQSQVLRLKDAVINSNSPLPKNWCVPIPENGTVLFSNDGIVIMLKVGQDGVHWTSDQKVFICLPVTIPLSSHLS